MARAVCPRRRAPSRCGSRRGRSTAIAWRGLVGGRARSSGVCLPQKMSSSGSLLPPALATRCHLIASIAIGRHAAPGHQDARQAVLRDRAAAVRRFQKQLRGCRFVLVDAVAVELRDGEFDHGVEIAGDRGLPHQPHCLAHVLRHAAAFFVHAWRARIALPDCRLRRRRESSAARLKSCGNCWPCR